MPKEERTVLDSGSTTTRMRHLSPPHTGLRYLHHLRADGSTSAPLKCFYQELGRRCFPKAGGSCNVLEICDLLGRTPLVCPVMLGPLEAKKELNRRKELS